MNLKINARKSIDTNSDSLNLPIEKMISCYNSSAEKNSLSEKASEYYKKEKKFMYS